MRRRQRNASGAQERSPSRASRHTPERGSSRHTLRRRVTVAAFRRVACATKMNCDIIFTYLSIRKLFLQIQVFLYTYIIIINIINRYIMIYIYKLCATRRSARSSRARGTCHRPRGCRSRASAARWRRQARRAARAPPASVAGAAPRKRRDAAARSLRRAAGAVSWWCRRDEASDPPVAPRVTRSCRATRHTRRAIGTPRQPHATKRSTAPPRRGNLAPRAPRTVASRCDESAEPRSSFP